MVSRLALAAGAAVLAACTSMHAGPATLEDTTWRVASLNGQATPRTDAYRVQFEAGRIGGRFGCNHFGGPYRIGGDVLTVGAVAATRMACSEPGMSFETRGFAVLQQPMRLSWHSDRQLTLSNATGEIALERIP